ncbi:MAG TPA: chain length determinant protein tyrosine kinase EpsG [Candidatus Desulfobacillus sp.]|nr:chain length determinant protein tyrosine kinase EpsG [Candidatus Desulfobacillus sp.]
MTAALSAINRRDSQARDDRSIGALLIDAGKLRPEDAEQILRLQKAEGLRFGEAAVRLGLASEADIQHALARQFDYPYLQPGEGTVSESLVAAYRPFSPQVEALRALRSQLMLRWFNAEYGRKALAIASPARGEGRSFLAANLAIVFSQLGERTLLIDADMRAPRQHALFGFDYRGGLSTFLSGRDETPALARIPMLADLTVMPAGPVPPNPQELLGRPAFANLLANLAVEYDVILIDTPAVESGADAQAIAAHAGAALLLARKDHTALAALQGLSTGLQEAGAKVLGAVLTDF